MDPAGFTASAGPQKMTVMMTMVMIMMILMTLLMIMMTTTLTIDDDADHDDDDYADDDHDDDGGDDDDDDDDDDMHLLGNLSLAPCLASAIGTGQNKRCHIMFWASHTAAALGLGPRRSP